MIQWIQTMLQGKDGYPSAGRTGAHILFALSALQFIWVAVLVTHAYYVYGPEAVPLMNLEWYLYGGTATSFAGMGCYGAAKYGDRFTGEGTAKPEEEN